MREKLKKFLSWLLLWFGKAMEQPEVNSRLVFLFHNAVTALSILVLVIAFVCAKDKTDYPAMVLALGGTHLGSAAGRMLTKKRQAPEAQTTGSDNEKGSTNYRGL